MVGLVFLLDQLSKAIILKYSQAWSLNKGLAFGVFGGEFWVTGLVFLALILLLDYALPKLSSSDRLDRIAFGLLIGGGISNLLDRLRWGGVLDFIDFGFIPSFNLADLAIFFAMILYVLRFFGFEKSR